MNFYSESISTIPAAAASQVPARLRLARSIEPGELKQAFRITTDILLDEISYADPNLGAKLKVPLNTLVSCLQENQNCAIVVVRPRRIQPI